MCILLREILLQAYGYFSSGKLLKTKKRTEARFC